MSPPYPRNRNAGLKSATVSLTRALFLLGISLLCLTAAPAERLGPQAKAPPDKPFGLSEEEYWENPEKNLSSLAGRRVRDGISGIVIDCPERVVVSERQTLPLLSFYSGPSKELHAAPFDDYAVVTAIHMEEDVVYAALAATRTNVPKPAGGPAPSPGFTGEYKTVDL